MENILKAKPSAAKGKYLKSVTMSSTMGPGVAINWAARRRSGEALRHFERIRKSQFSGEGFRDGSQ